MRHRTGGVGLTASATWASPPGRRRRSVHRSPRMASPHRFGAFVYTVGLLRCCGQTRGRKSVHRSPKTASRGHFRAFVYTVAPWAWVVGGLGIAIVYTNGRIGPLRAGLGRLCTLLGCCVVVDRHGDAIVYTNGRIGPLRTGLGHLCTLLRRESRYESRRELRRVARAPQPPRRAGGAPSLAPPAWSGRQALSEWRRC